LRLLFFDFGSGEIFIIVLAIILVFGPSKIPEIARGLGKFINEIKRASEDIKTEINKEADKIEREKRLEKYKASLNEKLEGSDDKKTINEPQ
jgi:TatA/E family protein of Tat protein translocase